jgi:hypothetical protein
MYLKIQAVIGKHGFMMGLGIFDVEAAVVVKDNTTSEVSTTCI